MNNPRRKALGHLAYQLQGIRGALKDMRDEEQEYRNTMPLSIQHSEKGIAAWNAITVMNDAVDGLDTAFEAINTAAE